MDDERRMYEAYHSRLVIDVVLNNTADVLPSTRIPRGSTDRAITIPQAVLYFCYWESIDETIIIIMIHVRSGVGTYGGAERRRVHLATVLLRPPSGLRPDRRQAHHAHIQ